MQVLSIFVFSSIAAFAAASSITIQIDLSEQRERPTPQELCKKIPEAIAILQYERDYVHVQESVCFQTDIDARKLMVGGYFCVDVECWKQEDEDCFRPVEPEVSKKFDAKSKIDQDALEGVFGGGSAVCVRKSKAF